MLTQLSDRVYLLPGGVNIGMVRLDDSHVMLIDAGLNDTAARKALRASIDELGSEIVAIVTTHGHADHFGGNAFLVKRTGAAVYAPRIEEAMLRYPILQPALLYGGADPLDSLRTDFLLADASPVDVVYDAGRVDVVGLPVEAVSLAGHSINQMGIRVDGVLFAADVLSPEVVIEKYRVPYLFSLTDHLETLEKLRSIPADATVPGHGPWLENSTDLLELNVAVVTQTMEMTLAACMSPATVSQVSQSVLNAHGAATADATGFYLLQPTIAAYLTHLTRKGALYHSVEANQSLWRTI